MHKEDVERARSNMVAWKAGPVDQGRAGGVPRRGLYWFQLRRALAADAQTCVMLFITTISDKTDFLHKKISTGPSY
jgi:hypothetical protein